MRKPVLQVARQGVGFVGQQDGAYAPVALGDQNGAQRTLADRKANVLRRAPRALAAGRHAQYLGRLFVKAAGGLVTRDVDRVRHRGRVCVVERTAQALRTLGGGVVVHGDGGVERAGGGVGAAVEDVQVQGAWLTRGLRCNALWGRVGRGTLRSLLLNSAPSVRVVWVVEIALFFIASSACWISARGQKH